MQINKAYNHTTLTKAATGTVSWFEYPVGDSWSTQETRNALKEAATRFKLSRPRDTSMWYLLEAREICNQTDDVITGLHGNFLNDR